jgi:hypothetical protein
MRIYLAGPMRGHYQFNFPAFHSYAKLLRSLGHEVCNPAEMDQEVHGKDFGKDNWTGDEQQASQQGFSLREALFRDLAYITRDAEAIAMMPGWSTSKGARAEKATADALGLKVLVLPAKVTRQMRTLLRALA